MIVLLRLYKGFYNGSVRLRLQSRARSCFCVECQQVCAISKRAFEGRTALARFGGTFLVFHGLQRLRVLKILGFVVGSQSMSRILQAFQKSFMLIPPCFPTIRFEQGDPQIQTWHQRATGKID